MISHQKKAKMGELFFLNSLFAVIILIRLSFILKQDFPLNDGGLFLPIIIDISHNNFNLPTIISYNYINIPFVYPPFAFYIAALLIKITPMSPIDSLRFLPVIFSLITVFVFYRFAYILFKSKSMAMLATVFFGLLPRSFEWMIMGAGLTRSFGQFFTISALYLCLSYCKKNTKKTFVLMCIAIALTMLSHPEWVVFEIYSITLSLFFFYKKRKNTILLISYIFCLCMILTSAWWVNILQRKQLTAFIEAIFTGTTTTLNISQLLPFHFGIVIISILLIFGTIFWSIIRFKKIGLFLFSWLILICFVRLRSLNTHLAIPLSLMMSYSIYAIKEYSIDRIHVFFPTRDVLAFRIFLYYFISIAVTVYLSFLLITVPLETTQAVNIDDRIAMNWIKNNTARTSKFIVVTDETRWWLDMVNEWFPAITKRKSILTVQGSEWLGVGTFQNTVKRGLLVKDCNRKEISCFVNLAKKNHIKYTHLYISSIGQNESYIKLLKSLSQSPNFHMVYKKGYTSVWEKVN